MASTNQMDPTDLSDALTRFPPRFPSSQTISWKKASALYSANHPGKLLSDRYTNFRVGQETKDRLFLYGTHPEGGEFAKPLNKPWPEHTRVGMLLSNAEITGVLGKSDKLCQRLAWYGVETQKDGSNYLLWRSVQKPEKMSSLITGEQAAKLRRLQLETQQPVPSGIEISWNKDNSVVIKVNDNGQDIEWEISSRETNPQIRCITAETISSFLFQQTPFQRGLNMYLDSVGKEGSGEEARYFVHWETSERAWGSKSYP